jgi:hypothetical protein
MTYLRLLRGGGGRERGPYALHGPRHGRGPPAVRVRIRCRVLHRGQSPEDGEHQVAGTVAGVAHGSGSERTATKTHCASFRNELCLS